MKCCQLHVHSNRTEASSACVADRVASDRLFALGSSGRSEGKLPRAEADGSAEKSVTIRILADAPNPPVA
jgi:hypothetical protein